MTKLAVKFYGPARDLAGESQTTLELPDGANVGQVAGVLAEKYPRLAGALGLRLAVNRSYVPLDHPLSDGDEVAVIPPVSGGAPVRVALVRDPIDEPELMAELGRHDAGALLSFAGTVRAELEGCKPLIGLEYEAYEDMAIEQMKAIRLRMIERFKLLDALIVHRLGRLRLGETSILVAVVSAHRAEAFEACRAIVDAVKADVPIWKKNLWADGEQDWVDPTC